MPGRGRSLARPITACPFCGAIGRDQLFVVQVSHPDIGAGFQVECRHCYATGPIIGTAKDAREVWARRVVPLWLTEMVEAAHAR